MSRALRYLGKDTIMKTLFKTAGLASGALAFTTAVAFAQDTTAPAVVVATPAVAAATGVSPETAYIFNTLLFLIGGFLVMFMAAGFAMLEAGLVRSKNVSMQCLKNIALYSIAGLMYWAVGYSLMYTGVDGGYIGSFLPYSFDVVGAGDDAAKAALLGTGYSTASDWFFQMVFVATAASIVSGTVAERIKIWPFLIFVVFLTGFIYPIAGSWQWGGGWLSEMGFSDFAGSTLVHSVGGWAALTGAILLGARKGKYVDGRVIPMVGSNIPLATLGTFILWLGWFGFNGASQLAAGSIGDISDVSRIFANTNLAACGGVVAALIVMQIMYGKLDVTMALNGALGRSGLDHRRTAGTIANVRNPDRCRRWCDRRVCRADARQAEDRRCRRRHPRSLAGWYLGHADRAADECRCVLRDTAHRRACLCSLHDRRLRHRVVRHQAGDRPAGLRRGRSIGPRQDGSRCRSLPGVHVRSLTASHRQTPT